MTTAADTPAPATRRPAGLFRRLGRFLAAGLLLALAGLGGTLVAVQVWAGYQFRAGRADLERYHTPEGYKHLQACLRVWPRDRATLLLAARAAARVEDFDAADEYLARAQAVGGRDDALDLEQVLVLAHRGDVDRVAKFCRAKVEQHHPATGAILEALSHGCLRTFRLPDAQNHVRRWLELEPDNVQALLTQAIIDEDRQASPDALNCYRRVLQLDPELEQPRLRLVDLLLELSQPSEAEPHLEWLRRRRPDDLDVAVPLARCRDQLGRRAEAVELLDGVLARDPHHPAALAERGRLALQAGDLAAAETWLREACDRQPGSYAVHYQLSQCLTREGKQEEARQLERRLKQIEDDVGRLQTILTVEMARTPHSAALRYETGMILLRAGSGSDGLRWLESALKEDPRYAPAHRALAAYYERTGQRATAARHRALAGDPEGKGVPDETAPSARP